MGADRVAPDPAPDRLGSTGLAGREPERARLSASIDQLLASERGVVVIRGRPGMGKTHLLRWMLAEAAGRTVRTTLVRPPSSIPLSIRALLEQVLTGLQPSADSSFEGGGGDSAVLAFAERLDQVVGDGCALLAVDDLRAVTPEGRRVLLDAVRLTQARIGVVCTWRTGDDTDDLVAELGAHGELPVTAIDLDGMSQAEVLAFAREILGEEPLPSLAEVLHERTLGVPLFMVELLRRWQAGEAIERVGGRLVLNPERADVVTSLSEALASAATELKPDELLVARCLAVRERSLTFEQLLATTALPAPAVTAAMAGLGAYGWVVAEQHAVPPGFRLTHQLYEEAALARADATLVAEIHERLASLDQPPGERAHHAVRALTAPPEIDAIIERAAREADAEGSLVRAAGWWDMLASRRVDDPAGRAAALLEKARALSRSDPKGALKVYEDVIRLGADAASVRAARVAHAEQASRLGEHEEGIAALREAVAEAPDDEKDDLRLRLSSLLLSYGRGEEARADLEMLATRGEARAFGLLAMYPYAEGDLNETCRLLEEGLDHSEAGSGQLFILNNLAWARVFIGEWNEAERALAMAIPIAERSGVLVRLWRLQACAIALDAWRGRIEPALDVGWRAARQARALAPHDVAGDVCHSLAIALLASGSPAEAIEVLAPYADDQMPVFSILMAEAALAAGQLDDARRAAAIAGDALAEDPIRAVSIARMRAELALAEGDNASAVSALEPWGDGPSIVVYEQARAMQVAAEALWRIRRRQEALDAAKAAQDVFEQLGAAPRSREVAAWLAGRGPVRRRREPGEVTQREREVLELAVQGLTNAQIAERLVLSPGTVKKHMENILARTGARRRSELHRYVRPLDE